MHPCPLPPPNTCTRTRTCTRRDTTRHQVDLLPTPNTQAHTTRHQEDLHTPPSIHTQAHMTHHQEHLLLRRQAAPKPALMSQLLQHV